jgi:hypothetical protein
MMRRGGDMDRKVAFTAVKLALEECEDVGMSSAVVWQIIEEVESLFSPWRTLPLEAEEEAELLRWNSNLNDAIMGMPRTEEQSWAWISLQAFASVLTQARN